jgi:pimeloyl-ACP methyl ester carboxylesterase
MAIDCSYTVTGQGEPLFLIHGIGARRATFAKLVEGLKDRFTCISYDLRGHGESPLPDGSVSTLMILSMILRRCGRSWGLRAPISPGIHWAG